MKAYLYENEKNNNNFLLSTLKLLLWTTKLDREHRRAKWTQKGHPHYQPRREVGQPSFHTLEHPRPTNRHLRHSLVLGESATKKKNFKWRVCLDLIYKALLTKQGVPSLQTKDRRPKTKIHINLVFGLWCSVFGIRSLGFGL